MADEKADEKTVRLGLSDYRLSSFETGVEGIVITAGGTGVPVKHEDAVREAAKERGVKLKKM